MKFLIITGMSGAGKSLALNYFEDKGYFCVDNLPPALISKFAELCSKSEMNKIALVSDIRGREFFAELFEELSKLEKMQIDYDILFLETSDEVLIRRYKESRRRHPLDQEGRILEAIKRERKILEELKGRAAEIIDTSDLEIKEFYNNLSRLLVYEENPREYLTISLLSFGFKYGLPRDADLVFDVRFLPNPHYISSLKEHTGEEEVVQDYVLKWPVTKKFMQKFYSLLDFLLPEYRKEGKSHLTIAVGCTGGKHRSVTTVVKLAERLKNMDYKINIEHRDIDK
ncbi:MAG: RNase adapter RapZ [Bacillota bacterium]